MSAPMTISYVNSAGTMVALNAGNYYVAANDLRNYTWGYIATNRPSGFGGKVTFNRTVQEKTLTIGIRGTSASAFNTNAEYLHGVTEIDILNNSPGRLYFGDQYLICYLSTASAVGYHSRRGNWAKKEITVLVTEPFWNTETTQRFLKGVPEAVANPKNYLGRYPYRYISSTSSGTIINTHYSASPMIITIYDAADTPTISIGSNSYALDAAITDGYRIIINQLDRTIVSMSPSGATLNLFDYRDKDNDIFAYIEPGENIVVYTGDFTFDITIVEQRSEPTWI
jgi:hypothetical protein